MKRYVMQQYDEKTEEEFRRGYGSLFDETKTIVLMTALDKERFGYLEEILKKLDKMGIEYVFNYRYGIIHTKGISVITKTIYDSYKGAGYGNPLYYVDEVNYWITASAEERVNDIKIHFREYTKKIKLKDIPKIVEIADMLCR